MWPGWASPHHAGLVCPLKGMTFIVIARGNHHSTLGRRRERIWSQKGSVHVEEWTDKPKFTFPVVTSQRTFKTKMEPGF